MQRITVLVLLAGCATSLGQRASMVRWTERPEDVAGCRFLGVVDGTSRQTGIANEGIGRNNARNEALEEAARRGATHVRWIGNDESFSAIRVTAETYDCSVQQPPSTAPAPAAEPMRPVPASRWWCVILPGAFGACEDGERRCEDARVDYARSEPSVSPCSPRAFAVCFRRADPDLGELEVCHTDATSCGAYRSYLLAHPGKLGVPVTECRVLE